MKAYLRDVAQFVALAWGLFLIADFDHVIVRFVAATTVLAILDWRYRPHLRPWEVQR